MARRRRSGSEWDEVRLGRLQEHDDSAEALVRGKYRSVPARHLRGPGHGSSRPRWQGGRQSFHFAHGFVSKHPAVELGATRRDEAGLGRPGRVYLYPSRGQTGQLRALGARYDRAARRWWVARAAVIAGGRALMRRVAALRTGLRRRGWLARQVGAGRAPARTPAAYHLYCVRQDLEGEARAAEVMSDAQGEISFGSIAGPRDHAEIRAFWTAVEAIERADGRTQCRMVLEMPHELPPARIREIAEGVVAPLAERGLPYHAVAHWPDVESGGDARNIHLHVPYHDRPAARSAAGGWVFAPNKDREAQGAAWVAGLRDRFAVVVNRVIDAENRVRAARGEPPIEKRYDPRPYAEVGVAKAPTRHLGKRRTQEERAGVATAVGRANIRREIDYAAAEAMRAVVGRALARERELTRQRRALAPPVPGVADGHGSEDARQALRRVLEQAADSMEALLAREAGAVESARRGQAIGALQRLGAGDAAPGSLPPDRIAQRVAWTERESAAVRSVVTAAAQGDDAAADRISRLRAPPARVLARLAELRREALAARPRADAGEGRGERPPGPAAGAGRDGWAELDRTLEDGRALLEAVRHERIVAVRERLAAEHRALQRADAPTRERADEAYRALAEREARIRLAAGGADGAEAAAGRALAAIAAERAALESRLPPRETLPTARELDARRRDLRQKLVHLDRSIQAHPELRGRAVERGLRLGEFEARPRARPDRER